MNPDVMQRLMMLLSGTQQAAPQQPQQQMAQPMQAMRQMPTRPGDWPGNDPVRPGDPSNPSGTGGGNGDGKGHRAPTKTEKQENRAALKGPQAYTQAMKKNIGMGKVTPGYGAKAQPAPSGFTKFIDLFTPPNGGI